MNVKRTAALGVLGGALAALLAGAATSDNHPVVETTIAAPTPVELRGAELAAEIARLRERLRPTTEPSQPSRNLFQFSRGSAARADAPPPVSVASDAPLEPPAPAPPPLRLVGIAEDPGPDGPIRTAIISSLGQLYFAKEGESVGSRYRVSKMSGEVAELTDLQDSSTLRLALK